MVVGVGIAGVGGLTPQFTSKASQFSVKICAKFHTLRHLTTSSFSLISSLKEGETEWTQIEWINQVCTHSSYKTKRN